MLFLCIEICDNYNLWGVIWVVKSTFKPFLAMGILPIAFVRTWSHRGSAYIPFRRVFEDYRPSKYQQYQGERTAPCSWVTGSAGWLYRAVTEYILGVQADFDGLKLAPCLPSEWENATIERSFRGARYIIQFRKGDKQGIFVDGEKIEGNKLPVYQAGTAHSVECWV